MGAGKSLATKPESVSRRRCDNRVTSTTSSSSSNHLELPPVSNSRFFIFKQPKTTINFFFATRIDYSNLSKLKNDVAGSSYEETSDSIAPGGQCSKDSSLSSLWRVSSALATFINGIHYNNRSSLIKLNNTVGHLWSTGFNQTKKAKKFDGGCAQWMDGRIPDRRIHDIVFSGAKKFLQVFTSFDWTLIGVNPHALYTRRINNGLVVTGSRYHWSAEQQPGST